jgi:hypothetical protein
LIIDDWKPFFAIWPVWVDAYDEAEMRSGKLRYRKVGWVRRQWYEWTDEETGEKHAYWRYRL